MTKDQLIQAIHDFYNDSRRSIDETREGLEEAQEEIENLLHAMNQG